MYRIMGAHPNFFILCIIMPHIILIPMNQQLGALPMSLLELLQTEHNKIQTS